MFGASSPWGDRKLVSLVYSDPYVVLTADGSCGSEASVTKIQRVLSSAPFIKSGLLTDCRLTTVKVLLVVCNLV